MANYCWVYGVIHFSCALKTVGGRVRGERDRGSATAIGPRTTGQGITASPPPPSDTAGQSVDVAGGGGCARETAGSGRVSAAVAHLSKRRRAA